MVKYVVNGWASMISQLMAHVRLPLFRNAYALAFSTATTAALGALYWIVAARFYSPQEVGVNSAVVSSIMLLSGLAQFDLVNVLNRFVPSMGRYTARFVGYCYAFSIAASTVASAAFIAWQQTTSPEQRVIDEGMAYALWFTLAVIVWSVFSLQDSVLAGLRRTLWIPVENIIFAILRIILLVILGASFPHHGIFASWTIPVLLALLPINYLIFRRFIPQHLEVTTTEQPTTLRQIVNFAAGNYVGTLFFIMSTLLLPLIVVGQVGAEANAYFYMVWVIRGSLDLIPTNMAMSLTTEGALDQANLMVYLRKLLVQMARLLLPIALVLWIAAPLILRIFGDSYSIEGTTLLRLVVLSIIPKTINVMFLSAARVQNRTRRIVVVQAVQCALVLGLSVPLLSIYGITGVGVAWLVSQTVAAVGLVFIEWQRQLQQRQNLPSKLS